MHAIGCVSIWGWSNILPDQCSDMKRNTALHSGTAPKTIQLFKCKGKNMTMLKICLCDEHL